MVKVNMLIKETIMPFVDVRIGKKLELDQVLDMKAKIGELISILPGKSEDNVMIQIQTGCDLFYQGNQVDLGGYTIVKLFGSSPREKKEAFAKALFDMYEKDFGLSKSQIYLNFAELDSWGVDGGLKFVSQ